MKMLNKTMRPLTDATINGLTVLQDKLVKLNPTFPVPEHTACICGCSTDSPPSCSCGRWGSCGNSCGGQCENSKY
jgi:hypothetical protein